jgi:4-hydroxyacetophenone monooxygenase
MTTPSDNPTIATPPLPEHRADALDELLRDPAQLDQRLADLDVQPLLLVYAHLTQDTDTLARFAPYIKGAWGFDEQVPDTMKAELRQKLIATFKDYAANKRPLPPAPSPELLSRMADTAVGAHVPDTYFAMIYDELNFDGKDAKTVRWRKTPKAERLASLRVLVIGAGFSGIAMGAKLKQAGYDYVIIEKNDNVGGTWYENTYPGVAVDTPNHFYSYSFRMDPDWDHYFARGHEIQRYIEKCYAEMGISNRIRFEETVVSTIWSKADALWNVTIARKDGSRYVERANAVISAAGLLNIPSVPPIPGMEDFKGPMFHSAKWDHSVSIEGKAVAVIGTGASGQQIIPAIADKVGKLEVFQRSPHWIRPNPLVFKTVSDNWKWALSHIPYYNKWYRFLLLWATSDGLLPQMHKDPQWTNPLSLNAENHRIREFLEANILKQVGGDEALAAKLTPRFPPYGKRMLRDGGFLKSLTRDNVNLVTGPIRKFTAEGIVDEHGVEHKVDVICLATGFKAQCPLYPIEVVGTNGSIRDHWGEDDPRAHLGITVPDFPNLFMIYGPNTNLGHGGSALFHSECQIRYIMQALREMVEREVDVLAVNQDAFEEYNRKVDAEFSDMVWLHPGVTSWYKNKKGRVVTNSPWALSVYHAMTAEFNPAEFALTKAG